MSAPVLYVDDDTANLVVFESALQGALPLLTASSGSQALEVMRREEVSVLLTDQRMPGMTGVELAEAARHEFPDTVRMLITAYSYLNAAVEAINRGQIHLYLRKPWEPRELRVALEMARGRFLVTRRLRELERRLVSTERVYALGVVTAGIAHELRNPIAAIKGNVELCRTQLGEIAAEIRKGNHDVVARFADLERALKDSQDAAEAIVEITRSIELSTRSSEMGEVDLREVISLTARSVRGELQRRGQLEVEAQDVPRVKGSRTQLGQVVLNLAVNALEAMDPARRASNRVVLRLHATDAGVELVVQDNGPGIPPETLPRIFDPFFTTKEDGGTGLGLAISRKIVQELGGSLDVESAPGEGTRFRVILPALEKREAPAG